MRWTLALATALIVSVTGHIASARDSATRMIDRTVVCRMPGVGYPDASRFMTFSAVTGRSAVLGASNGPDLEVRASVATGPLGRQRTGFVAMNRDACSSSRLRVPLTTTGLRGGLVTDFARTFECDVPTRVVMRIQARFRRPTSFTRDRVSPMLIRAPGRVTTASLAVRSLDGRPIAFASVDGTSAKTRILVAPSRCVRTR